MSNVAISSKEKKLFTSLAAKTMLKAQIAGLGLTEKAMQGHINALEKAVKMYLEGYDYFLGNNGLYQVASSEYQGVYYQVTQSSCNCLAGQRGWACKHQYLVKLVNQISSILSPYSYAA